MVDNISKYINETNFPKATTKKIENSMLDPTTGSVATKLLPGEKLKGKLVIKDYPLLTHVVLGDNELEEVTFINCPELTHIFVDGNNELTKLDIEKLNVNTAGEVTANKLDTLYCGESKIVEIDFTYCEDLKDFGCPTNPHLDRIINIDHVKGIEKINMSNSGPVKVMHAAKEAVFRGVVNEVKELFDVDTAAELPLVDWYNPKTKRNEKRVNKLQLKKDLQDKIMAVQNPQLTKEVKEVKEKLESQKDYEEIKTERDQLQQQLAAIRNELGLAEDSSNQQAIDEIKKLKNRPTSSCSHDDYDTIKAERDRLKTENDELKNNKENPGMTKEDLLKSAKTSLEQLGVKVLGDSKLQNATTAQKVEEIRSEIIKNEFSKLKDEKNSAHYLNLGLGAIALGSLIFIAWMVMRQNNNLLKTEPEKKK